MQHRGQESCGIAVSDTEGPKGKVDYYKDMGLVNEVFDEERLNRLHGNIGVGHVRYSTAGASNRENAQPLIIHYIKGTLAVAHNGNLTNAVDLREKLKYSGAIFQTTIDSEPIAYYIARERVQTKNVQEAVSRTMDKIEGAYALAVMSPRKLIGARDPYGFKPLCIGKRDNTYFLSSETCALDAVGAEFVRDVEPGEIVTITPNGILSDKSHCLPAEKQGRCIFEYIYFARRHQRVFRTSACRPFPRERFPRGCGHRRRRAGIRQRGSTGLRHGIRHPLRHGIREKQLRRPHIHQTEAEQP